MYISAFRHLLGPAAAILLLAIGPAGNTAQAQSQPAAQQAVSGRIKVNGKSVPPGYAIPSDSIVEAGAKSSAVVSLGKLGRVEVLPSSKMKISFDNTSITVALESGGARIWKAEGATATVTTNDGEVLATTPLAGSFTVDTQCGNTLVTAHDSSVELRASGEPRTVSPGAEAAAGTSRTGCKPRVKRPTKL